MKIVEANTIQTCKACNVQFLVEKSDCIVDLYWLKNLRWLFFRCSKCERLNEFFGIPDSFRELIK